jgi:transposase
VTGPAMPGCSGWPTSKPQAGGSGPWKGRAARGGDRQLNRALAHHRDASPDPYGPTRAYTSRRIAQGNSEREIRRCLKRALARQLYRLLERTATNPGSS